MSTPKNYIMSEEDRKAIRDAGLRDELPERITYAEKHLISKLYSKYRGTRFQVPCNCGGARATLSQWWGWLMLEAYWKETESV